MSARSSPRRHNTPTLRRHAVPKFDTTPRVVGTSRGRLDDSPGHQGARPKTARPRGRFTPDARATCSRVEAARRSSTSCSRRGPPEVEGSRSCRVPYRLKVPKKHPGRARRRRQGGEPRRATPHEAS
ncbi:hypothetical protein HPB48_019008 [Haemaphysalis longicornis]|uniref:Uncharacterized protein n=1 Tax=Haemaphysalis longicornis TaxID=44386 RepID=A0A9J6G9C6_HAELO|nr:hypothetical protein HPB48_019008 [Haemaphysalis longicornis]